jgi:hypothetical protein
VSASARTADLVRKGTAAVLSVGLTVLLFRVMFRAASGRGSWSDPELWIALALAAAGIAWVKAARRVQRSGAASASSSEKIESR